jgi:hypothetical protein
MDFRDNSGSVVSRPYPSVAEMRRACRSAFLQGSPAFRKNIGAIRVLAGAAGLPPLLS